MTTNDSMPKRKAYKWLYGTLTLGAAIGFAASFWQMLEKLTLLKNTDAILSCNLNSVFNCSNVLNAHQSSVFGFPNSMLCMTFFALMFSAGLLGWTGSRLSSKVRLAYQAMSLFFVGFGLWYFWQSIFNIGVLCIFCLFCFSGLLMINASWFRLNYDHYGLSKNGLAKADRLVAMGADLFFWALVALIIALEAIIKFA